ncbi:MAG TPA: serine/threonine-protein kinase [Polyangiaceae bacterium]
MSPPKDDREEEGRSSEPGEPSDSVDDFLRNVAAAPFRTMPSARTGGEADPHRLAHFQIVERLGEGGMGIVYRATDEKLGRVVALKVLPSGFETDPVRRGRFLREARSAAAVTHQNVATVYEVGESGGRVYIAMELVEGRTLRAILGDGPMAVPRALNVASQIAAAVSKAHAAGIVHRDLKPDNVIVGPGDHLKVLDFGLAKRPEAKSELITQSGDDLVLGTPAYMPPEQARGEEIGPPADVFSLGVILYEMLTGRRPFTGKTTAQVLAAVERDTPATPSSINPQVPASLDRVVTHCLAKNPKDRYADAAALLEELSAVHVDAPVRSEAARTVDSAPVRRRRPSKLWLVGAGVAVAAGIAVTAMELRERSSGPASSASGSAVAPAAPGAGLACPPIIATGVDEPAGWLGAAAADIACRRAASLVPAGMAGVLTPAQLLDLPRPPSGEVPRDPYGDSAARGRCIAAARLRAAVWLDGSIAKDASGFRVSLVEIGGDGGLLASGEAGSADLADAVDEALRRVLAQALPPATRGEPIHLEAGTVVQLEGGVDSRELALSMLQAMPTDASLWRRADRASRGEGHVAPLYRAWTAWLPEEPRAWERSAFGDPSLDPGQRVALVRRAYALAPQESLWGFKLAEALVRAGRAEEARVVAGDMMRRGPDLAAASQGVLVRVDAGEALFGAALARGEKLLEAMPRYGEPGDWPTLSALLDVGLILGEAAPLADAFARRFVLEDPPRLARDPSDGRYVPDAVARVCANASRDVARACFARLRDLFARHDLDPPAGTDEGDMKGLERFGAGDMRGAADAWRPLVSGDVDRRLYAVAFDATGDADLAERVDERLIAAQDGNYAGASLSHVRAARRAMARGDHARAKQLAQQVVDAWGAADVPVPAVAEMKALLARLR